MSMTSTDLPSRSIIDLGKSNCEAIIMESRPTLAPPERIKCTYASCTHWFQTEKEMRRHKRNEPDHFYCHKCDVDCEDDTAFMIHQIVSPRHTVCPSCGMEFKSASGRDRHVEISHAASQRIPCRGCQMCFTKASALMRHIENDECRVIRLQDFQRERAERSIMKDAFQSMLDPTQGQSAIKTTTSVYSDGTEESNVHGGVSLLESTGPHIERDWQGMPVDRITPLRPLQSGSYQAPQPQQEGSTITALSKFPVLPPTKKAEPPNCLPRTLTGDLMDVNQVGEKMSAMSIDKNSVWANSQGHSHLFPQSDKATSTPASDLETESKYDQLSEVSFRTYGSQSRVNTFLDYASQAARERHQAIPNTTPRQNENSHITLQQPPPRISRLELDKHYDSIREVYVCPGIHCKRTFKTPGQFHTHLLSPAHVGGNVRCPSCLRMFKTHAGLLTHMESGAKNCNIRNSTNYNQVLREVSAGLIGTSGHLEDGSVKYMMPNDEGWTETKPADVRQW